VSVALKYWNHTHYFILATEGSRLTLKNQYSVSAPRAILLLNKHKSTSTLYGALTRSKAHFFGARLYLWVTASIPLHIICSRLKSKDSLNGLICEDPDFISHLVGRKFNSLLLKTRIKNAREPVIHFCDGRDQYIISQNCVREW
jgi:hypothetical protein